MEKNVKVDNERERQVTENKEQEDANKSKWKDQEQDLKYTRVERNNIWRWILRKIGTIMVIGYHRK